MKVERTVQKGSMYVLCDTPSQFVRENQKEHNYIVISGNCHDIIGSKQGYVECMVITSQKNNEVKWELPIMTLNGWVGYIVPYNIFSYEVTEFKNTQWRGCMCDTEWGTVEEFIRFLMECYVDIRHLGDYSKKKHKKLLKKIEEYRAWFNETYPDAVLYKDRMIFNRAEIFSKPDMENPDTRSVRAMSEEELREIGVEKLPEIPDKSHTASQPVVRVMDVEEQVESEEVKEPEEDAIEEPLVEETEDEEVRSPSSQKVYIDAAKYKKKIKEWSMDTLHRFLSDVQAYGVDAMSKEMHCTLSAIYSKKRAVNTEIARRTSTAS